MGEGLKVASQKRQISKKILSAAWSQLKQDKSLITLPVIGGVLSLLSIGVISAIGFFAGAFSSVTGANSGQNAPVTVTGYIFAGVLAYATTVFAVFFQCAVIVGAQERLNGGDPSVGSAIQGAMRHLPKILLWSLVATTVGLILRALSQQKNIGTTIVSALAGFAWAIATFFVLPVIIVEGRGPIKSISRSSELMKATWGSVLRTNIRYGITVVFIVLGLFAAMFAGIGLAISANNGWPLVITFLAVIGFGVLCVVLSALNGYVRVMLYRYATAQPVPGFDQDVLAQAMLVRN